MTTYNSERIKKLQGLLIRDAGYELLPYGKMIRARQRVRQIKEEIKALLPESSEVGA